MITHCFEQRLMGEPSRNVVRHYSSSALPSHTADRYLSSRSSLSWCRGSRFHKCCFMNWAVFGSWDVACNGKYKTWGRVDNQGEQTRWNSREVQLTTDGSCLSISLVFLREPEETVAAATMSRSPERISSYRRHFEDSSSSSYQVRVSSPSPTRRDVRHASASYPCRAGASSMRVESVGRRTVSAARRTRMIGAG